MVPTPHSHQESEVPSRYVSPPEIAPHRAGAAVDLTLVNADGTELDMGTRVNASLEESDDACYRDAVSISPPGPHAPHPAGRHPVHRRVDQLRHGVVFPVKSLCSGSGFQH